MARPIRIEFPDAVYHVTTRGEAGENIFVDEHDRQIFLNVLEEVVRRTGWVVHAYVLMDNHYHLVVETPQPNLSRGMRQLNGVYTQRFNSVHNSGGRVFQGRFKAILVERNSHMLDLCRHVVLNPLRVKAVKNISRYRWSSYRATAGAARPPTWLDTTWTLQQFARSSTAAQRKYAEFVEAGMNDSSPLQRVKSQILLGSAGFIKKMQQHLSGKELAKVNGKKPRRPLLSSIFTGKAVRDKVLRNQAIQRAYQEYGYTMSEIADAADIHFSTVSKIIKSAEAAS